MQAQPTSAKPISLFDLNITQRKTVNFSKHISLVYHPWHILVNENSITLKCSPFHSNKSDIYTNTFYINIMQDVKSAHVRM